MHFSSDILALRGLGHTLLIGPRAAFGRRTPFSIESEDEARRRLLQALATGALGPVRLHWSRWRIGGDGLGYAGDRVLIDRIAAAVGRGRLAMYVIPHLEHLEYAARPDVPGAAAELVAFQPIGSEARVAGASRTVTPMTAPPRPVWPPPPGPAPTALRLDTLSIEQRLAELLRRTALRMKAGESAEFVELSTGDRLARTVAALAAWTRMQHFGPGFVLSALLLGAGPGVTGWAVMDAANQIHEMLGLALKAKSETDFDAATDLLVNALDEIGVRAFSDAITRYYARVTRAGPATAAAADRAGGGSSGSVPSQSPSRAAAGRGGAPQASPNGQAAASGAAGAGPNSPGSGGSAAAVGAGSAAAAAGAGPADAGAGPADAGPALPEKGQKTQAGSLGAASETGKPFCEICVS